MVTTREFTQNEQLAIKSVVLNTGTTQNQPEPPRTIQNHPEPSRTIQNQPAQQAPIVLRLKILLGQFQKNRRSKAEFLLPIFFGDSSRKQHFQILQNIYKTFSLLVPWVSQSPVFLLHLRCNMLLQNCYATRTRGLTYPKTKSTGDARREYLIVNLDFDKSTHLYDRIFQEFRTLSHEYQEVSLYHVYEFVDSRMQSLFKFLQL